MRDAEDIPCQRVDAERVKALDKEIGVLLGRFGVRGKDEALHMRVGMRADDVVQQRGAFGRERDHARGHLGLGAQQDLQPALPFGLRPPREQAFIVLRRVPRRGARDGFVPRVVREADDRQARFAGVGAVFGDAGVPRRAGGQGGVDVQVVEPHRQKSNEGRPVRGRSPLRMSSVSSGV